MQMSIKWSWQALKFGKGNHRRTEMLADSFSGIIGNTYNTPSILGSGAR